MAQQTEEPTYKVQLNDEERKERAFYLAKVLGRVSRLRGDRFNLVAKHKLKLKAMDGAIEALTVEALELAEVVNTKEELQGAQLPMFDDAQIRSLLRPYLGEEVDDDAVDDSPEPRDLPPAA